VASKYGLDAEPVYANLHVEGISYKNRNRFKKILHKTQKMLRRMSQPQGLKKMYSQDIDTEFIEKTCLKNHALLPSEAALLASKYKSQPDTFPNYIKMYCMKKELLIKHNFHIDYPLLYVDLLKNPNLTDKILKKSKLELRSLEDRIGQRMEHLITAAFDEADVYPNSKRYYY